MNWSISDNPAMFCRMTHMHELGISDNPAMFIEMPNQKLQLKQHFAGQLTMEDVRRFQVSMEDVLLMDIMHVFCV